MNPPFPSFKPTPTLLRKCADDILRQDRGKAGQIAYTRGSDALVDWFHDHADATENISWGAGTTIEKATLCHFFVEFLEGESL